MFFVRCSRENSTKFCHEISSKRSRILVESNEISLLSWRNFASTKAKFRFAEFLSERKFAPTKFRDSFWYFGAWQAIHLGLKKYSICDILTTRHSKLWNKITSNTTALDDLLPPRRTRHLRSRGHDYILPRVRTSRFKSTFVNRCLFSIVCH